METKTPLDNIYTATEQLRKVAHRLEKLSECFAITGNLTMSETLYLLQKTIEESETAIDRGISAMVNANIITRYTCRND